MRGFKILFITIATLSVSSACYSEYSQFEGPPPEVLGAEFDAGVFEDSRRPDFQYGYVSGPGVYYEVQGDRCTVKELPPPGSPATVFRVTDIDGILVYYYVIGDGWEGWVNWGYLLSGLVSGGVNTGLLNCRAAPSADAAVIGKLKKGDVVPIDSRSEFKETIDGAEGYWYEIDENKWVFGPYIDLLRAYDLFDALDSGLLVADPTTEVVIKIVEDVLEAPPRPCRTLDTGGYKYRPGSSVQAQALFVGCNFLLHYVPETGETEYKKALEWAEKLSSGYNGVTVSNYYLYYDPAAEAAMVRLEALAGLGDSSGFFEGFRNAFAALSAGDRPDLAYESLYGLEMLDKVDDDEWPGPDSWRPSVFETAVKNAPTRLLKAASKYYYGKALVSNPETVDSGMETLLEVITEYPGEEFDHGHYRDNFAQDSLLEYARSLPDDASRRQFLLGYVGNDIPGPVRIAARWFLANGDPVDTGAYFGPLESSYSSGNSTGYSGDTNYWWYKGE